MDNKSINIIIVEDDIMIRNFIQYALNNEGFSSEIAGTGKEATEKLQKENIDIALLDLGLPDIDGIEIIKDIRKSSDMPIIVISARDQDKEKALALDTGADDYITKPFSITELLARIRVSLRHINKQTNEKQIFKVGDLCLDLEKHLLFLDENEIHTTPLEYSLITFLFKNIGKVMTTNSIIKEVWGKYYDGNDTQALRATMAGLRRKIEKNPGNPRYIMTEIGVGYRLVDE